MNKVVKRKGSTDRERRDRAIGAALTLVGLIAIMQVPDARQTASYMDSNAFGAIFLYHALFALSFLLVIGPSIMLPHRAGVLPLAMACVFSYLQIQADLDTQPKPRQASAQGVQQQSGHNQYVSQNHSYGG